MNPGNNNNNFNNSNNYNDNNYSNCNNPNCNCNNNGFSNNNSNNNNGWNNNNSNNNNGWNNNNVPPYQNGGNVPPYMHQQPYQLSDTARSGLVCIKTIGIIQIVVGVLTLLTFLAAGIFALIVYFTMPNTSMPDPNIDYVVYTTGTAMSYLILISITTGVFFLPVLIAGIVLTVLANKHLKNPSNKLTTVAVLAIIFGGIIGIIGGILVLVGKDEEPVNNQYVYY